MCSSLYLGSPEADLPVSESMHPKASCGWSGYFFFGVCGGLTFAVAMHYSYIFKNPVRRFTDCLT